MGKITGALILAAALTTTACEQLETPTGPTLSPVDKQNIAASYVARLRMDVMPASPNRQRRLLVYALSAEQIGMGNQPILVSLSGDGAIDRGEVVTDAGGVGVVFFTQGGDVTITAQHSHAPAVAVRVPVTGAAFEVSPYQ